MQIYLAKYTFLLKICARTCVYEKLFVILHAFYEPRTPRTTRTTRKLTININIYANNQTETWIGHSV